MPRRPVRNRTASAPAPSPRPRAGYRLRLPAGASVRFRPIADRLFLNGVNYCYESRYELKAADENNRLYKPDFCYPVIGLYHDHFALDAQGQAPAHFEGYLEGVAWKRTLRRENGTDLSETTSHGLRHANDLQQLEAKLAAGRGA